MKLTVQTGNGGHGCAPVHCEKFKPLDGPDGSNGGDGGSMILRVVDNLSSLMEYHRQSARRAADRQPGRGDHQRGAKSEDVVLTAPAGTVVSGATTGEHLADLTESDEEYVAAVGGEGRLGNEALAITARKAPGFALLGEEGESQLIQFELEVLADIGLVGFPSAGKSSLIAAISRARPEIADCPFITLVPNLGVVVAGDLTYTTVDVPGLIEGVSLGKGLGFDFLRHIECCQTIVHVIDLGTWEPGREPVADLDVIEGELATHGGLEDRGRLVVLNKLDLLDAPDPAELVQPELEKRDYQVFEVNTKTGEGLNALKFAMAWIVEAYRAVKATEEPPKKVLRPKLVGRIAADDSFTIMKKGDGEGGFLRWMRGMKPERWIRRTDFSNAKVTGYLAGRLNWLGVEEKLLEFGTREDDAVAIGGDDAVVFDSVPQVKTGAEILSRRSEGSRLEGERPTVARRRRIDAEYHAREVGEVVDED